MINLVILNIYKKDINNLIYILKKNSQLIFILFILK